MILGIDGGGTRCRARLVAPDGVVLGEGLAGSANLTIGVEAAAAAVLDAASQAFGAAGLSLVADGPNVRAGLGLAGANVPSLASAFEALRLPFAATVLASDAVVACLGAHGDRDGGILIVGTGSQGLVIAHGRAVALGGWGFAVSDDASGAVLGRRLVRAAVRAAEGLGPRSPLTDSTMAGFDHAPANAVLWAAGATPRDYATHVPALFEAALDGDEVAIAIVGRGAAEADVRIDRLAALGAPAIALMGGLAAPYQPWLAPRSRERLVEPAGDALEGAIRLAREGAPG